MKYKSHWFIATFHWFLVLDSLLRSDASFFTRHGQTNVDANIDSDLIAFWVWTSVKASVALAFSIMPFIQVREALHDLRTSD